MRKLRITLGVATGVMAAVAIGAFLFLLYAESPTGQERDLARQLAQGAAIASLATGLLLEIVLPRTPPQSPSLYGRHWIGGASDRLAADDWRDRLRAVRSRDRNYPVHVGPVWVPDSVGRFGILLLGSQGSGKTLSLRLLIQHLVHTLVSGGLVARIVISDPKSRTSDYNLLNSTVEMVERYTAAVAEPRPCPIYVLSPFDSRCSNPVLSDLVQQQKHAQALAESWIRGVPAGGDGIYWRNAARLVLAAVMFAFAKLSDEDEFWDFRDVLLAIRSPEVLTHILDQLAETRGLAQVFLHLSERQAAYVCGTLIAYLREFEPLAAGWHQAVGWEHAPKRVELRAWAEGRTPGIVYLGGDDDNEELLGRMWSGLVQRMLSLNMQHPRGETWYVLDEAGTLESGNKRDEPSILSTPLSQARQKGIRFALAYQSFLQLKVNYGEDQAHQLSSHLENIVVFKQSGTAAAEAASKLLGEMEILHEVENESEQWGPGDIGLQRTGTGTSTSRTHALTRIFQPGELQDLPRCSFEGGMTAVVSMPEVGRFRARLNGRKLRERLLPHSSHCETYEDWPNPLELKPWDANDYLRLGIPQPPHLDPAEVPTTLDPSERKSFDELVREYAPEAYQYLADHDEFEDQDGENQ